MSCTNCAVRQGTVDFSTMVAPGRACCATTEVTASKAVISVADPAPLPRYFVGVFTAIMTISASLIHLATSVVKKRLGWRAAMVLIAPLFPSHWLIYSEDEVEGVSDAIDALDFVVGSVWKVHSREPSRATRRISFRPGS